MKNEKLLKAFGEFIARERKKRGISLEKLAYESDLAKGTISELEQGNKEPKLTTLIKIAETLDVPLWRLIKDFQDFFERK